MVLSPLFIFWSLKYTHTKSFLALWPRLIYLWWNLLWSSSSWAWEPDGASWSQYCVMQPSSPQAKLQVMGWAGTDIGNSTYPDGRTSPRNTDATIMLVTVWTQLAALLTRLSTRPPAPAPHWMFASCRGISPHCISLIFAEPASSTSPKPVHEPSACSGGIEGNFMFGAEWRGFTGHLRVPSKHILPRTAYFNKLYLVMSCSTLRGAMHKWIWKYVQKTVLQGPAFYKTGNRYPELNEIL